MSKYKVGVISDTHGLLREEALQALKGSDIIIHAGDVGKFEVLEALRLQAPTVAVKGNCDNGILATKLKKTEVVEVGEIFIYVLHDISELDLIPEASGISIVISGHSHKANNFYRNDVLYLNPGSAGPKRFTLPVSVAVLNIEKDSFNVEVIKL